MFQAIPRITKNLLILNVLVYLATELLKSRNIDLTFWGGLHYFESPYFAFYQLVTYLFLHASFTHLFFNMFALWMFGCDVERAWGPRKYLLYYFVCGIGAGLCQELVQYITMGYSITIGASGAVYAVLLAFGMIFPRRVIGVPLLIIGLLVLDLVNTSALIQGLLGILNQVFFFAILIAFIAPANSFSRYIWRFMYTRPIEARWCVFGYIAIEVLYSWKNLVGDTTAHMAHLGGMLFGFLLIYYWKQQESARFDRSRSTGFFDQLKNRFSQSSTTGPRNPYMHAERTNSKQADMEYNARKRQRQEETDRILDKIRKSGYDSLTKEEKKYLFEVSREK